MCNLVPSRTSELIDKIASHTVTAAAFDWVCERCKDYFHNSDIWVLRPNWPAAKPELQEALRPGQYEFSSLREIRTATEVIDVWCAQDSLVLKALSLVLTEHLSGVLSDQCCHIKGNGGAKRAVQTACNAISPGSIS